MRTIKTQDGKVIINAEKVLSFSVHDINGKGAVWTVIADSWINNDSWRTIAEYSTEERALKVFDMLNEWLTKHFTEVTNLTPNTDFELIESIVMQVKQYNSFQMLQDSEELD